MSTVQDASPGALLRLIREGRATTRTTLAEVTGLARSTIAQRAELLLEEGLIYEAGDGPSTGGRRPVVFAFNEAAGVVLAADLGATHARIAVTDLGGHSLVETERRLDIAEGPDAVLGWLADTFEHLLADSGRDDVPIFGVGIGVPGPVEFATGRPVDPPIMPGWDGVAIPDSFRERFDSAVYVDNDVNIMALGEYWTRWRSSCEHLLFVKVGTGIGCGIVAGGRIHRGAQGAAGDIGHIAVSGHDDALCRCGKRACLEAVAGGWALAQDLGVESPGEVAKMAVAGDPHAIEAVFEAGRLIGEVLAGALNFFNPDVIVVGGSLAQAEAPLLAGITEVAVPRALSLATRDLRIVSSALAGRAGIVGAATMVIEEALTPRAVDRMIASRARALR